MAPDKIHAIVTLLPHNSTVEWLKIALRFRRPTDGNFFFIEGPLQIRRWVWWRFAADIVSRHLLHR